MLRTPTSLAVATTLALASLDAWAAPTVDVGTWVERGGAAYARTTKGAEVRLTLDPRLQRAAERLLARAAPPEGAIVASDPRTGRILAWASVGARDAVAQPLGPAASVFKLVTAAALLDHGVTRATQVCVPPGGDHAIAASDLTARGTSCMPFGSALGRSVNLVFARLARDKLTSADLRATAAELGFAGTVPIDVAVGASTAVVPTDALGLARASAGFWAGKASPLGVLYATQAIANEGESVRLWLLDGPLARRSTGAKRALSKSTAHELGLMMRETVRAGTCTKAFAGSRLPAVAAKTGTLVGSSPARMYSWFTGYAPADQPTIVVTVMLANDLSWRMKGNQVGRLMLEEALLTRPRAPIASSPTKGSHKAARAVKPSPTRHASTGAPGAARGSRSNEAAQKR
jgi:peptidoglycan glycosyltransferase